MKKGNNHVLSFRLEFANEKYIDNESTIMQGALQLLKEFIFSPHLDGDKFPEKIVEREKLTLKNKITSIYDDKIAYANMRLIDEMFENELFQIHTNGYEEDLQTITATDLYTYYQSVLETDRMDIYILGDIDEQMVNEQLINTFERDSFHELPEVTENPKQIEEIKEVIETQPVQQAKLHIGYRTNCTYKDENYFALQVFNGLFGGFPSSKLFINVREKNSLAYYASSRIESHKGLLIVFSGIEPADYKQARAIIDEQMNAMKNGNFTDDEMEEIKDLIISEIEETLDHSQGIIELLYQQVIGKKTVTPLEFVQGVKEVSKDDILEVANQIERDTVFLLTNEGGRENE